MRRWPHLFVKIARSTAIPGLALSLSLHGVVAFLLQSRPPAAPLLADHSVELTLNEKKPTLAKGIKTGHVLARQNTGTASPRKNGKGQANSLTSGLFQGHHLQAIQTGTAYNNAESTDDGHGWSSAVRYGNEMGLEKTLDTLPFFLALHKKIDSNLIYPEDFSRHRLTGIVRVEALLTKDGRLLHFTSTVAEDRVLQTYCLVFLTQVLSRPLAPVFQLKSEEPIAIAFEFDFRVRIPDQTPATMVIGAMKNRLAFGREATVDLWLNEKINEIFTHYIPPIIPIPGGVYVDFYLAYQWVQNMINDTPTESDARAARIEKLHENLKRSLRADTPPDA